MSRHRAQRGVNLAVNVWTIRSHGFPRLIGEIAVLAVVYAVAGRLALLLAIPPGYATAVWPAAGIALACLLLWGYRLWPGVLIGSFIVNVATSWDSSSIAATLESLAIAVSIGAGAALQALLGAYLIRRFVGYRNILTQEVDAVRMLLLGGPVSCIVNSLVGVTTLWVSGLLPASNYLFNWWTWWVGDSIGVLIFMPLVCAWTLRPARQWLYRQIALTVPMVSTFSIVVVLFFYVSAHEETRLRVEFERNTGELVAAFENNWAGLLAALDALRGFYAASDEVTPARFKIFVGDILRAHPELKALEWAPKVNAADRSGFERNAQSLGLAGFQIREQSPHGELVSASPRPDYFPVLFIEPRQGNESALGLDLGSEAARRKALIDALRTGRAAATAGIQLVQDEGIQGGMLMVAPVIRDAPDDADATRRARQQAGFVVAVARVGELAGASLGAAAAMGLRMRIVDITPPSSDQVLYVLPGQGKFGFGKAAMSRSLPLDMAGRKWSIEFQMPLDYLVAHRSWQAWGLLAGGLSITGLLGMLLLVLIARQVRVDELVAGKTAELRSADERFQHYAHELERSNRDLEQFAYVASHDLQAPLRSIVGFCQILQEEFQGKLGEDADKYLHFTVNSAAHMQSLIRDLLAFSRVGRDNTQIAPVDCGAVLERARESLQSAIRESGASISSGPLPVVSGSAVELGQLFLNLVGNAIKFHGERKPEVQISAWRDGDDWIFAVRDNGIGIQPEQRERIFEIFQRLHRTEEYEGTGIGLAICRKVVERHGGHIWVESEAGRGSTFFFSLRA